MNSPEKSVSEGTWYSCHASAWGALLRAVHTFVPEPLFFLFGEGRHAFGRSSPMALSATMESSSSAMVFAAFIC